MNELELAERRLRGRTGTGLRATDAYDGICNAGTTTDEGEKKHVSHTRHDTACEGVRGGEADLYELEWMDDAGEVGDARGVGTRPYPSEGMSSEDERGVPIGVEGRDSSLWVQRRVYRDEWVEQKI